MSLSRRQFGDACLRAIAEAQGWRMELRCQPFGLSGDPDPPADTPYWWHHEKRSGVYGELPPIEFLDLPAASASGGSPDVSGAQSMHDTRSGGDSL